jgi:hypothetical protein
VLLSYPLPDILITGYFCMSLTLLNPLFLLGLLAVALPVLIHRLTRRKAVFRKFSAVRLLLQSQRIISQPQRLKHLFLLALRVLAMVSLALMMARPVLMRPGLLAKGDEGAKVIVLDNSLSMGYREDRGERYGLAQKAAQRIVRDLKGQVMIIPAAAHPARSSDDFRWMTSDEARKKIDAIPITFRNGDLASALRLAYRQLKDLKVSREIIVIGDMARGDWEGFDVAKLGIVSGEVGVTLLRIGAEGRDPNLSVKEVTLSEGEAVVGVPNRLEVTVSNFSNADERTLVQLHLSGTKRDQKTMELKAGEEGKASFDLFLDRPGWVDGEVRLSGDRLPQDDAFFFSLKGREKVKVLVIDGAPQRSLRASESYYLVNALQPGGSDTSPFLVKVVTEDELGNLELSPYDALFTLNVAQRQMSRALSFLELGKPVFIFLGERVLPEGYNTFLPWILREVKEADTRPERIAQVDYTHEALKPFSGSAGEGLKTASFRRHFKIEGTTKNLLTLDDGDPLLVEAHLGKGDLFLFTSSADLDWNDLPLKASYLPLIQGLLKVAVGLSAPVLKNIRIGGPFEEEVHFTQMTGSRGGPGIYRFVDRSEEVRLGVNPPLQESDLMKMSDQEMGKRFGTIGTKVVEYQEEALASLRAKRKELWPYLLSFLLLVLAIEMGVANGLPRTRGRGQDSGRSGATSRPENESQRAVW